MCSMGNARSTGGRLRTALNTGSYGLARNIARDLPHVELADAIRLTCLAASEDTPSRFDALAVRCMCTRQPIRAGRRSTSM